MSVLAEAVPATLVSSLAYPFDIVDAPGSSGWAASSSSLDKTISATISGKAPRPQETKVLVSESDIIRSHARSYLRRRVLTVEQNRTSLGRSVSSVSNNSLTIGLIKAARMSCHSPISRSKEDKDKVFTS
jgi:hypothetical protein